MNRPKVFIVDDHPLFRTGLRQVILDADSFDLIGQSGDGKEAMLFIEKNKPDVAVLDLKLPGMTGLEIARRAQEIRLPTRVIILTMHNEEELCTRALDHGVTGFILKENAVEEIIEAIAAVAEGRHYFSPSVSGHLIRRRQRADSLVTEKPGLKDLTKAEVRILKLIAVKKTSREIAAELFISPRTVEAHRANISAKLDLRGSHSLLYFALSHKSEL
ncbi:MAG TPA: response regulator transcription factor [Verrucomicrobiae bacterium]|jgi:DNA-binding NarL/FixJ family response regulator|nr:response regulator transcription factor [Verrucomicrobiae bacterium]